MGRLIASVREAEERLAGLAKALQSAWEEELAEATSAREAARRSLSRADAMVQAAASLGRQELASRLEEVVRQLHAVERNAAGRLEELVTAEKALQHRLDAPEEFLRLTPRPADAQEEEEEEEEAPGSVSSAEPYEPAAEPAVTVPAPEATDPESVVEVTLGPEPEPAIASEAEPESEAVRESPPEEEVEEEIEIEEVGTDEVPEAEIEIVSETDEDTRAAEEVVLELVSQPRPPPPPPPEAPPEPEPASPATGLSRRVGELERVAARLPGTVLEPALEEVVALCRLLGRGASGERADQARALLERLRKLAAAHGRQTTFGLSEDEFADWGSLAADARARRQAAVDAVKASRARTKS